MFSFWMYCVYTCQRASVYTTSTGAFEALRPAASLGLKKGAMDRENYLPSNHSRHQPRRSALEANGQELTRLPAGAGASFRLARSPAGWASCCPLGVHPLIHCHCITDGT